MEFHGGFDVGSKLGQICMDFEVKHGIRRE